MFMVKSEYANIMNLVKVRIISNRKGILWFCGVAAFMFLFSLAGTVSGIINSEGIQFFNVTDFSNTFFFGLIIAFIICMFLYKQTNDNLSMFPQTNNSRFISSQIMNYAIVFFVGLVSLVIYLLYYGVIKLLSAFKENVYLALSFDMGFIIGGFFVFIAYSFLVVALIELAGAILRKWTYYAGAVFMVLVILATTNIGTVAEYAPKTLAFLIREPSVGLFLAKAAALWLAIVAISLVINRFTVYYKTQNTIKKKNVFIVGIVISTVLLLGVSLLAYSDSSQSVSNGIEYTDDAQSIEMFVHDFFAEASEIRIDVSHLPKGSNIKLEGENIDIIAEGTTVVMRNRTQPTYVSGTDALNDLQGNTIVVKFRPPFYHVNGIELYGYAFPHMTAYLENDTLHLDYSIEEAHVVVLRIWGIARQFESFRDKGLVKATSLGYSSGGSMNANILISVE